MSLRLLNAYTKTVEDFVPLDPQGKQVLLYCCGPTVYNLAHIGNFRSFVMADVLRRVLERRGYAVRQVMNITDVGHMTEDHLADAEGEDKLVKAAREIGKDPYDVARHFEALFAEDAAMLRLRNYQGSEASDRRVHPRAADHVAHMLEMVQALLDRGHAYVDSSGQAYFRISSFPDYGRLSGKKLDELQSGKRVEVRTEKEDPRDFALWKVDPKHLMQWDPHSPDGWPEGGFALLQERVPKGMDPRLRKGFPGWHIECSAMARSCLGDVIDIHTGGEDNLFPHHECENAQTVSALGCSVPAPDGGEERASFARYWVHCRHLLVNNRKMSKRDGTFYILRELADPSENPELAEQLAEVGFPGGVPPVLIRCALMSSVFSKQLNFSFELLKQARSMVGAMQGAWESVRDTPAAPSPRFAEHLAAFDAALDDSLNVSGALDALVAMLSSTELASLDEEGRAGLHDALEQMDEVLGLLDRSVRSGELGTEALSALAEGLEPEELPALASPLRPQDIAAIERQLALRMLARKARDWARADAIRDGLDAAGVLVKDGPGKVLWSLR